MQKIILTPDDLQKKTLTGALQKKTGDKTLAVHENGGPDTFPVLRIQHHKTGVPFALWKKHEPYQKRQGATENRAGKAVIRADGKRDYLIRDLYVPDPKQVVAIVEGGSAPPSGFFVEKKEAGQRGPDKTPRKVRADRKGIGGRPKKPESEKVFKTHAYLTKAEQQAVAAQFGDATTAVRAALDIGAAAFFDTPPSGFFVEKKESLQKPGEGASDKEWLLYFAARFGGRWSADGQILKIPVSAADKGGEGTNATKKA